MSSTNLPTEVFKMAVVRAPRRPLIVEDNARRIIYGMNSPLHGVLVGDRAGSTPRADMTATANDYVANNSGHIIDQAALNTLFPGFDRVDDYLRTAGKNAVKADLQALVESADVLNTTAALYVASGGYAVRKSQVWDNVFVRTVLKDKATLRTAEVRTLRLLNLIEKIAANDALLNTGAGVWSLYLAMVVLPADVFPMPDVPLPAEPVTKPADPDQVGAWATELKTLSAAYAEVRKAYDDQVFLYRNMRYPERKETDPDDDLQPNVLTHDPLVLSSDEFSDLSSDTQQTLADMGVKQNFAYMPHIHDRFGSEIRRLGRLINAKRERQMVVQTGGTLVMLGNECVQLTTEGPC